MKHYLVTGAAGFIGAALAKNLLVDGNKVVTIDNLSTGFKANIPEGVIFIEGNCQDKKVIEKLAPYKFDTIFHVAGQSSGEISFEDPVYDLQTNTQSTLLLLKYALESGCNNFVYASTMSVYGDHPEKPIDEKILTRPKSFYAVGKLASERYLQIFCEQGIKATALRLFNCYGPGQNMENMKQGMVSIFLSQAIANQHVVVKGSPDRFRDLVYIDDVVNSFIATLDNSESRYNCYNVGTGIKTTVGELIKKIDSLLPYNISIKYAGSTPGDQFGIYADNQKIFNQLGWSPTILIDEGIQKMINSTL
jgi:UDP-glucose 4-epimerase